MFTKKMVYRFILLCTSLILYQTPSVTGYCTPLLLTPFIQEEDLAAARKNSLVNDTEGIIPKSHAGFITVDENVGNHLFFWFFPTLNSNSSAPLLIWLNGGPGESSMIGLLLENGPIQLGKSNSGETIYVKRNNSWVDKFSMLYIDSPVGAGYSYSDNKAVGYRTTQDGFTRDLYEFLKQFYQIFPEYLQKDLYIGGESYAGKFVPAFAYRIHQEMQRSSLEFIIPLKGIYLGGPVIDARVQFSQLFDLYYTLGYMSQAELVEKRRNFPYVLPPYIFQNPSEDNGNLFFWNTQGNLYTYDWVPDDKIQDVMTSQRLRSLLHVGNTTFVLIDNDVYLNIFRDDLFVTTADKLSELMDKYKVLIYNGDLDGIINAPGLEAVLSSLQWSSLSEYTNSKRVQWSDVNGTGTLKGVSTQTSTFCRVVIRGAGHRSAWDQPDNTLEMIDQFVNKGCLG